MENKEDYLDALTAYSKNPTPEIPPILEQYLNGVAKNGETLFQWPLLKPLVVGKMEQVIAELKKSLSSENIPTRPNVENVQFDVMHKRIMDSLQKFNGAPFTIQRLCELLIDPKQHYKRSDKFMRGLEKNVLVVSTVDPYGRKVVSDSGNKHLVNGMDLNGSPFFPRDSNLSSNLPPVPGWVTSAVTVSPRLTNSNTVNTEEQKQSQPASQEASLTTNGVVSGLVSSLYNDNGEQPLAVQTEEVVEETVVTMETSDVGPVATDGGEALAEDEEEEEMGTEDTNASSTSSSSSSSEELSTSDSGESPGVLSAPTPDSSSRPWASIANEGENSSDVVSQETDTTNTVEAPSDLTPVIQPPTDLPADQPTSVETVDKPQADVLDHSFGFNTTSASQSNEGMQQSESNASSADTESSTTESASESSSSSSSSSILPSNPSRSYAEVVSGSNKVSITLTTMEVSDSSCDSVSVLERLVDSVETSTELSHIQSATSPTTTESEEPKAKRFKSDSESCELNNQQVSSSSPSDNTTEETPNLPINSSECENECQMTDVATDLTNQTPEQCCNSAADSTLLPAHPPAEASQPSAEPPSESLGSPQDLDTSSQLTSSSDSQGFDMCKETERKSTETEEEANSVSSTESMEHE